MSADAQMDADMQRLVADGITATYIHVDPDTAEETTLESLACTLPRQLSETRDTGEYGQQYTSQDWQTLCRKADLDAEGIAPKTGDRLQFDALGAGEWLVHAVDLIYGFAGYRLIVRSCVNGTGS